MKRMIFILVIFLLLINCSENDPIETDPPNRVMLVMKEESFDTLETERGIDAEPNPNSDINGIQLVWYEPADKYRVDYYNIYRSNDAQGRLSYNLIGSTQNQINLPDTTFIDTTQGLALNRRYWYYVTAVSEGGRESVPSDTVFYTLIEKATQLSINNFTEVLNKPEIIFRWSIDSDDIPGGYYLRVEYNFTESFRPLVFVKEISVDEVVYDPPQIDTVFVDEFKTPLVEDGNYRWRVDCVGTSLYEGSESDWAFFTVDMEQ